uniref:Uncharacterized protein n=1 Tax=Anguilla anguilla TaxID=7936 RepID=A0A0E9TWU6_ANGAN
MLLFEDHFTKLNFINKQ